MKRRTLSLVLALILVLALAAPVSAANDDPLSFADAVKNTVTPHLDGEEVTVTYYTDCYLANPDRTEDQLVDIFVPEGATKDSPILLLVNNGGWQSNSYDGNKGIKSYGMGNNNQIVGDYNSQTDVAGVAMKNGYVVVAYGCRSRNNGETDGEYLGHSPSTMTDTKAVIRYLRYNADLLPAGDTDRIVVSGTSGGGALSTVIAASGNSPDYFASLYEVGAAGIEKQGDKYVSTIGDDVFAVIAYCPITDLGNACAGYEWTYNETRKTLNEKGLMEYTNTSGEVMDNDYLLGISDELAAVYAEYIDELGMKDESGNVITSDNLAAHIEGLMKKEIEESIQEVGIEQMKKDIADVNVDVDWLKINDDGTYEYNYTKHLEWLARKQTLKVPSSFSNYGMGIASQNEDNLFGSKSDEYSPFNEYSWNHDSTANNVGKDDTGLTWDEYMKTEAGEYLALQTKMTSAVAYLSENTADSAPYWYVRHGMADRDTSFAVETSLYYTALNNSKVEELNFEFAWLKGHSGNYDVAEAYAWLAKVLAENEDHAVQATNQTITVDGKTVSAEVYNIDGSNYFKLRDVAALLNGTDAQFSVSYNTTIRTAYATAGEAYTAVGGELATGTDKSSTCVVSDQTIVVDGTILSIAVYNIGGNTFFKLRDLGTALDFGVDYDAATRTALITTK